MTQLAVFPNTTPVTEGENLLSLDAAVRLFFPQHQLSDDQIKSLRRKWNVFARRWANEVKNVQEGHGQKVIQDKLWKNGLPRSQAKSFLKQNLPAVARRKADAIAQEKQLEAQRQMAAAQAAQLAAQAITQEKMAAAQAAQLEAQAAQAAAAAFQATADALSEDVIDADE